MSEELERDLAEPEEEEEDLDSLLRRINDERDGVAMSEVLFKIKSDIGRDDFRAFLYHSILLKHVWTLPLYIIMPPLVSFGVSAAGGYVDVQMNLLFTVIMYVLIAGIIVFRAERSMKRRDKENPNMMKLTPTTFTFYDNVILNAKKTGNVRVPYTMMTNACESKKRFFLYFDNRKAMVIRKEDVARDADLGAFRKFIKSKVSK